MSDFVKSLDSTYQATIKNIESILAKGALKCTGLAKQSLIDHKHYVTGALSKHTTAVQEGLTLEFGNDLPYANAIETGIVDIFPTVNDIQTWLNNKVSLGHITDRKILGMAVPIANSINKSGRIKNWNPFMKPAWEETLTYMKPLLDNALVEVE